MERLEGAWWLFNRGWFPHYNHVIDSGILYRDAWISNHLLPLFANASLVAVIVLFLVLLPLFSGTVQGGEL